ncbi:hypothetical protein [Mesobaculum littorinae]|uniref:hypothetical protein n=1 Tax=Mesobaculum littorinae TaxID=2486419 RepID=UPI0013E3AD00|nr:hypothetical protein [Mesobaculum littorinae]
MKGQLRLIAGKRTPDGIEHLEHQLILRDTVAAAPHGPDRGPSSSPGAQEAAGRLAEGP